MERNYVKTVLEVGKYYKSKTGEMFSVLQENDEGDMVYIEITDGEIGLTVKNSVKIYEEIDKETFIQNRLLMVRCINQRLMGRDDYID